MNGPVPVLVIFGPTAVGKTAVAGRLFGPGGLLAGKAEIVSADSMQVYRGMDIGTAKPDPSFLTDLPHHLIDIKNPDEQFGVGEFVSAADTACADCYSRGNFPVMLGGTGFYIRNFLLGMPETPTSRPEVREQIKARMVDEGAAVLMDELRAVDPASASRIHVHDEYRIIRALEVHALSGRPLSSFALSGSFRSGYRFKTLVLHREREELYARIELRVAAMFRDGLAGEFRSLLEQGYGKNDPGMQAIGYREFFSFDPPGSRPDEVMPLVSHATKRYAKRQETFVNSIPGTTRIHADDHDLLGTVCKEFFQQFS